MAGLKRSQRTLHRSQKRRGAIAHLAALLLIPMCCVAAFAIDLGYLTLCRTQAQACADAAALAGAATLLDNDRLAGDTLWVHYRVRKETADFAEKNTVGTVQSPRLFPNHLNWDPTGDVLLGFLEHPGALSSGLTFDDPSQYNSVQATIRFNGEQNERQPFFFARVLGWDSFDVEASATGVFNDQISGFRPNCSLMPFTVHIDDWNDLVINRNGDDEWTFDQIDGTVNRGGDDVYELNMYPAKQTTPGNFGTVDIGNNNNATPDLVRQIREGPDEQDLEPYGGRFQLDECTGTLLLNGDTGISAGIKGALEDVVGLPRTITLYDQVTAQGNNTYYRIVGFAGVTIVDFSLTGNNKYVIVQPSYVSDPAAITGNSVGQNYYVGRVTLAR